MIGPITIPSNLSNLGRDFQRFTSVAIQNIVQAINEAKAFDYTDVDGVKGGATVQLPSRPSTKKIYTYKKTDATFNAITIVVGASGQLIDGISNSTTLNTRNEQVQLIFDGNNWQLMNRQRPAIATYYTPTITGLGAGSTTQNRGMWFRSGPGISLFVEFIKDGTPGSGGTEVAWTFPWKGTGVSPLAPTGFTQDIAYPGSIEVTGWNTAAGTAWEATGASLGSSDDTFFVIEPSGSGFLEGSMALAAARAIIAIWVPVTGWN